MKLKKIEIGKLIEYFRKCIRKYPEFFMVCMLIHVSVIFIVMVPKPSPEFNNFRRIVFLVLLLGVHWLCSFLILIDSYRNRKYAPGYIITALWFNIYPVIFYFWKKKRLSELILESDIKTNEFKKA
jgi:hypothetical protein